MRWRVADETEVIRKRIGRHLVPGVYRTPRRPRGRRLRSAATMLGWRPMPPPEAELPETRERRCPV